MPGPFHTLDVICARRQALIYVSSPVCEVDFSSSGEPVIVLNPFRRRRGPTGFAASVVNGRIRFRWDTSSGAICYSLYRSEGGTYVLVAECIGDCVEGECTFTCEDCGPGTYVVTSITPEGETEVSDEVTVGGFAPECPDVAGQPVPIGLDAFDIDAPVEWPEMTVSQLVFTQLPFPDDDFYYQAWPDDYPPGHYDVKFITGFFDGGTSGSDVCGTVHMSTTIDDNSVFPFSLDIVKHVYLVDPPNTETIASGFDVCAPSYAAVETQQQAFWNGSPRRRFKNQTKHENDGGEMRAVFNINIPDSFATPFPYRLQLIQIDGLIQQPRQIRVQGWDFIKGNFSPGVQTWDGVFTERVTYVSDDLVYVASASGSFGGALAYYVGTGHPTSPNGAGWVVDIYFDATTIEWTGLKTIDNQAIGQFRRAVGSPNVPACCVLEAVPEEP